MSFIHTSQNSQHLGKKLTEFFTFWIMLSSGETDYMEIKENSSSSGCGKDSHNTWKKSMRYKLVFVECKLWAKYTKRVMPEQRGSG